MAALFSAFAYSGAGVMVVLDGIAGQAAGTVGGAIAIGVVYAIVAVIAIGLVVRRARTTSPPVTAVSDRHEVGSVI